MIFHEDFVEVPANLVGIVQYALVWAFAIAYQVILMWAMSTILLMIAAFGVAYMWAGVTGDKTVIQAWPKKVGQTSAKWAGALIKWLAKGAWAFCQTTLFPALIRFGKWAWKTACRFGRWLRRKISAFAQWLGAQISQWFTDFERWLNNGRP